MWHPGIRQPTFPEVLRHLEKEVSFDQGSDAYMNLIGDRYTDFIVNEILPSGSVVHLTSLKARPVTKQEASTNGNTAHNAQKLDAEEAAPTPALTDKAIEDLVMNEQQNKLPATSTDDHSVSEASHTATAGGDLRDPRMKTDDSARIVDKAQKQLSVTRADPLANKAPTSLQQSQVPPTVADRPDATSNLTPTNDRTYRPDLDLHAQNDKPNPKHVQTDGAADCDDLQCGTAPDPSSRQHELVAALSTPEKSAKPESDASAVRHDTTPGQEHETSLPPHLRSRGWQSPSPKKNLSTDGAAEQPAKRKKWHVILRPLKEGGWEEVTEEQDRADQAQKEREIAAGTRVRTPPPPPPKPIEFTPSTVSQWNAFAGKPNPAGVDPSSRVTAEDKAILQSYFTVEVADAIRSLYNRVCDSPGRPTKQYGQVKSAVIDRETRTRIHQDIRRIFHSKLESSTDDAGNMIISALPHVQSRHGGRPLGNSDNSYSRAANQNGAKRSNPQKKQTNWKELGGDFLHFTLYKENKDTMEAISWLAKQLYMMPKNFEFAGTKDRRGVTAQRVSVYRVQIDRLISAGRSLKYANVGDFEYQPKALQLGELDGNEFVITLRDCKFGASSPPSIEKTIMIVEHAVNNLNTNGFINYYGLQRFGTFGITTDAVGMAMLKGDFRQAVDLLLYYKPECLEEALIDTALSEAISEDDRYRAEGIQAFRNGQSVKDALSKMPRRFSAESNIIRFLSKPGNENDFLGALQSIARNQRLMYVHAYQSLVWNHAASKRWKNYGNEVIEGDLVLVREHPSEPAAKPESLVDVDGEVIIQAAEGDRANNPDDVFERARPLTAQEAASGKFTIFDIVLPTPGYDITYPANPIGKFYRTFMASESGGGLDPLDMRRPWKDTSLSGSYRKLLAKPRSDIAFEVKAYDDEDEQFVETDMDRIRKSQPKGQQPQRQPQRNPMKPTNNDELLDITNQSTTVPDHKRALSDDVQRDLAELSSHSDSSLDSNTSGGVLLEQKKIAVILKMQLGTSQYATMALRELMKAGGVKVWKTDYAGGR